ncbi:uncharacterized protein C17orf113-like, partial [Littorina saxatilis]|uniref:uncharacterized protein C17orf113-like n=1 Tax=Littorina saxatilis TaxID=31220 RepID=UPI0038B4E435
MKKQRSLLSFLPPRGEKRPLNEGTESESTSRPSTSAEPESQAAAKKPTSASSTVKRFQEKWCKEFLWLRTEGEGENFLMFCEDCKKTRQQNGYTRGCRNFQHSSLEDHSKSLSHRNAVGTSDKQLSMKPVSEQAKQSENECLNAQIRTVLYMAQENIAASKFESLLNLQRENGCSSLSAGVTYKHHETVADMEEALLSVTKQELREKIDRSDYVGIVIDETLNCTLDKKLIVFARIVLDGTPETVFLGNYTIDNGTAECVYAKVREVLREWGIDEDHPRLAGLASDGASVMTGQITGVGVRMKEKQAKLIHLHCIAHRTALATKDATNSDETVADYRLCLQNLFKLYRASGDRTHRLKQLCDALDEVEYKCLKHPISVRWLSLGKAVDAVKQTYPALILELEEEGQRGNTSAVGLLKKAKMFIFVAITYMLADVIPVIDRLNLTCQKDNVNPSTTIKPMVESTTHMLTQLLDTPGDNEREFSNSLQGATFNTTTLTHLHNRGQYE